MPKCVRRGTSPGPWRRPSLICLEVDRFGLAEIDQKIMRTVLEKFGRGPVGIKTIAASIGEEPETIEEVYEPYLIQRDSCTARRAVVSPPNALTITSTCRAVSEAWNRQPELF